MNVLFLPKYGRQAASARYRFMQYEAYYSSAGITPTISPLFDDDYLNAKFKTGQTPALPAARAFIRRVISILGAKKYDLVVIHCEIFPFLPAWFEDFLRIFNVPYTYDYDDAIFHNYDQNPNPLVRTLLKNKVARIISGASLVTGGSEYLCSYARRFNDNVENVPTVVDVTLYPQRPKDPSRDGPFTIGWIGSPSTAQYVVAQAPALREFCARHAARLILVGAGDIDMPGVPTESRPWSESTEIQDLMEFDVGIMPLDDSPWARGKCAFKLIQYMAGACPVIASPVGMNSSLVNESGGGLLAANPDEWVQALTALYKDEALRTQMGEAGRKHVEEHYSLQVTGPRFAALLKKAVAANRMAS